MPVPGQGANEISCTVTVYLRSLLACCRVLFGRCTREHCTPKCEYHDGQQVYSTPYSAAWAHHVFKQIRRLDPHGLLFAIDVGWDKTSLSKVQSAYPLYVKANAWPLDEQNKHRGRICWGYYGSLPEEIQLQVSAAKATELRRRIAFKSQQIAFREFDDEVSFIGQGWPDATGTEHNVYVRVQNLIVDYIDYAQSSGTLQNQTCPVCHCPTGSFHVTDQTWAVRTAEDSLAKVTAARTEESSLAAMRRRCRAFGLQTEEAPLWSCAPGLDPHSGGAYARLHNDFEGIGKVTFEACLQRKQRQVGRSWPTLVRQLDAWVTDAARFTHFTTFSRGLSHFFYSKQTGGKGSGLPAGADGAAAGIAAGRGRGGQGQGNQGINASRGKGSHGKGGRGKGGRGKGGRGKGGRGIAAADEGEGGEDGARPAATVSSVNFGKITTKQVYRDIFRFWRVMLVDLLSEDEGLLDAVGLYLEWLSASNAPAHVELTLTHLSTLWESAIGGFVAVFGKELYRKRVKTCLHKHVPRQIKWHGALRNHSDELHLETSHLRGAKDPWRRTNHKKPEAQMAKYVARRDILELLDDQYMQQKAGDADAGDRGGDADGGDGDGGSGDGSGNGGCQASRKQANELMLPASAEKRRYQLRSTLGDLARSHPQLSQLQFAARQYLYLTSGGNPEAAAVHFPDFDSDLVHIRPGLRLNESLDSLRVSVGGRELVANVLQGYQQPIFIGIDAKDHRGRAVTYYAQLILCFRATYLSVHQELCYVRWLHTAKAVANAAGRQPTTDETRGPFASYRWAIYPRGRQGHPARNGPWYGVVNVSTILYRVHMVRSMHDIELFRLNTDVWLEHL